MPTGVTLSSSDVPLNEHFKASLLDGLSSQKYVRGQYCCSILLKSSGVFLCFVLTQPGYPSLYLLDNGLLPAYD